MLTQAITKHGTEGDEKRRDDRILSPGLATLRINPPLPPGIAANPSSSLFPLFSSPGSNFQSTLPGESQGVLFQCPSFQNTLHAAYFPCMGFIQLLCLGEWCPI